MFRVSLTVAPRTFVFNASNGGTDGGRIAFKMWLLRGRRARNLQWVHGRAGRFQCVAFTLPNILILKRFPAVARTEHKSFSKRGSRPSAARTHFKHVQHLHGWTADRFQQPALA